jgi:putative FmdB family regulatory protein
MPIYVFRCLKCGAVREETVPISRFSRELGLRCDGCGAETAHRLVPSGGAFSCKGPGFPTANQRLKRGRGKKSAKQKRTMDEREKSGEGVSNMDDLGKPLR